MESGRFFPCKWQAAVTALCLAVACTLVHNGGRYPRFYKIRCHCTTAPYCGMKVVLMQVSHARCCIAPLPFNPPLLFLLDASAALRLAFLTHPTRLASFVSAVFFLLGCFHYHLFFNVHELSFLACSSLFASLALDARPFIVY